MNKFISTINATLLLFVSIDLSCSDTNSQRKRIVPQSEATQTASTSQSIFTAQNAQIAAKALAGGVQFIATAAYNAYTGNNNSAAQGYITQQQQYSSSQTKEDGYECPSHQDLLQNTDSRTDNNIEWNPLHLQENFNRDPIETITQLNQFANDYFNTKNPNHPTHQKEINSMFEAMSTVARNTQQPLSLDPVVANKQKGKQAQIFSETLAYQINNVEPQAIDAYEKAIEQAQNVLEQQLIASLHTTKIAASNYIYLDNCSRTVSNTNTLNNAQAIIEIDDTKTYKNFLSEMRQKYATATSSSQQHDLTP